MTTKEKLYAEIERLDSKEVDEVYQLVRTYAESRGHDKKQGLLTRLMEIQIEGPVDFSTNFDLYLNGEKRVEENLP